MAKRYQRGHQNPYIEVFFFDVPILITPVLSFGHCVVCSFLIYGFLLPLWYLFGHCVVCS
jgi:hypothetical protein